VQGGAGKTGVPRLVLSARKVKEDERKKSNMNDVSREIHFTIRWFVCGKWRNLIAWRILQFALWINETTRPNPRISGYEWTSCGDCKSDKLCSKHNDWNNFPVFLGLKMRSSRK
jgi:hypothetical protein